MTSLHRSPIERDSSPLCDSTEPHSWRTSQRCDSSTLKSRFSFSFIVFSNTNSQRLQITKHHLGGACDVRKRRPLCFDAFIQLCQAQFENQRCNFIYIDFRNEHQLQMNYNCFSFSSTAVVSQTKILFCKIFFSLLLITLEKRWSPSYWHSAPAGQVYKCSFGCLPSECVARQRVAAFSMSANNCILESLATPADPC